jgi:endonuclease/exonuclease/phosphatase (EEP) superfamily protein YafD
MHRISQTIRHIVRHSGIPTSVVIALLTSSCAHQYVDEIEGVSSNSADYGTPAELSVSSCRDALAQSKDARGHELDGSRISLLNWNIQKERQPIWSDEFQSLAAEKDLVLMQEASLRHDTINDIDASKHWSFAPGYTLDGEITGVMTLSRTRPLTQCSFVSLEPLLRTSKATSVTEYALSGTDQTLVVVNIHAVNFSMGTGAFRKQFEQVQGVLSGHRGPVILSGDFNTWRKKRIQIVEDIAASLELQSVTFGDDQRVRVFGNVLDHIYVRGLSTLETDTEIVKTSDHNPMSATLGL